MGIQNIKEAKTDRQNEVETKKNIRDEVGFEKNESPELVQNIIEAKTDGQNELETIENIRDEMGVEIAELPEMVQNITEAKTDGENEVATIENIRDEVGFEKTESPELVQNITEAKTNGQNKEKPIDNVIKEEGIDKLVEDEVNGQGDLDKYRRVEMNTLVLTEKLDSIKKLLNETDQIKDSLGADALELLTAKEALEGEVKTFKDKQEKRKNMNEKVKDALRNLIAFNESLTQEKSELLRQVNKSKKSNAAATKMMKQLIKEKQQWTEEKQQWTEEKKQLTAEKKQFTEENKQFAEEKKQWTSEKENLQKKFASDIKTMKDEKLLMRAELIRIGNEKDKLKADCTKNEDRLQKMASKIDENEKMKKLLKESTSKIIEYQLELEKLRTEHNLQKSALVSCNLNLFQVKASEGKWKKEANDSDEKMKFYRSELIDLKVKYDNQTLHLDNVQNELTEAKMKYSEMKDVETQTFETEVDVESRNCNAQTTIGLAHAKKGAISVRKDIFTQF